MSTSEASTISGSPLEPSKVLQARADNNIGDGMNIALSFDSGYAMPASVTLRSIAENVHGPIMLYIFDCGLTSEDKKRLAESLSIRSDITLLFMNLPPDSLASNLGAAWGRIDMMKCLPVDRVLYLDADLLVIQDLRELWNIDLKGNCIAAAPDIYCPMGHDRVPRGEYFNSGVLLIDVPRARANIGELESLCYEMKDALFFDQDPLNIHFRGRRLWLNLRWNAHGLGSLAGWPDEEREKLPLEQLKDPAIIHFTGPVNPWASSVLDPYFQPIHSKPWGFAGSPGHPYEKAWWNTLEKTAWRGLRETTGYKERCEQAKLKAWKLTEEDFNRRLDSLR